MAQAKVRCAECGATNTDALAERCRLCACLLPDAAQRRVERLGNVAAGPNFTAQVESEVEAWREIEQRGSGGPKSRRPIGDAGDTDRTDRGRRGWRRAH